METVDSDEAMGSLSDLVETVADGQSGLITNDGDPLLAFQLLLTRGLEKSSDWVFFLESSTSRTILIAQARKKSLNSLDADQGVNCSVNDANTTASPRSGTAGSSLPMPPAGQPPAAPVRPSLCGMCFGVLAFEPRQDMPHLLHHRGPPLRDVVRGAGQFHQYRGYLAVLEGVVQLLGLGGRGGRRGRPSTASAC